MAIINTIGKNSHILLCLYGAQKIMNTDQLVLSSTNNQETKSV